MLATAQREAERLRAEAAVQKLGGGGHRSAGRPGAAPYRRATAEAAGRFPEVKAAAADLAARAAAAVFAHRLADAKRDPLIDRAVEDFPKRFDAAG